MTGDQPTRLPKKDPVLWCQWNGGGAHCDRPAVYRMRLRSDLTAWKPLMCAQHAEEAQSPEVKARGRDWLIDCSVADIARLRGKA
jgi:hypothetical protein